MAEIPHDWQAYFRLQQQLANSHRVDSKDWGREAGLNFLLQPSQDPAQLGPTVASAARKHRYRVACLRKFHAETTDAILQDSLAAGRENPYLRVLEVEQTGEAITKHVSRHDWRVLTLLAAGADYAAVAQRERTSGGALRVRVSRLRTKLARLAA